MITYSHVEGKPAAELFGSIHQLYRHLFSQVDDDKFNQRINESPHLLTVMAWSNNELIGFKMGYALDSTVFYSWIGGVNERYRKNGIAQELMQRQHLWCSQNGFQTVRTKTMNRWKSMLILNLKNDFDIIETYTDAKGELKIILEKKLN